MRKFIKYILVLSSVALFILGKSIHSFNMQLIGVVCFWLVNIIYSCENIRSRIYFLFFNITIFVFLISRPFISFMKGNKWWHFSEESVNFALNSLMLSLVFMFIGYVFCECKNKRTKNINLLMIKRAESNRHTSYIECTSNSEFIKKLRKVSLCLFYLTVIFFFIGEIEKVRFMRFRNYTSFYSLFRTNLPYLFTALGNMHKYCLCIFLATMPNKRTAFFPLVLYTVSSMPALIIGMRNPIVLNIIFVFIYYFTRDVIDKRYKTRISEKGEHAVKKWLGKGEWTLIIALLPVFLILLSIYNYSRDGMQASYKNAVDIVTDLFYKQGVSFDVLCIGFETIPKVKYTGFSNYTFGGIIDYFFHSKFAQILWGAKSLGEGNNISMALYSNSFAHRMSYASRGQEYLDGHGWGSSYILETYADFGYIGVILFSFLLGMLLYYIIKMINKSSIQATFSLVILTEIYFCPRDAALGWLNFIVYLQFIVPLVTCYLGAHLFIKKYNRRSILSKATVT